MPLGNEFQKEIVDTYLRGQTATTISTVYHALYHSATTTVASGSITCAAADIGDSTVTIAGLSSAMAANSLVRFSGDTSRVYQVRALLSADGALQIHPPLKVAVTTAHTVEYIAECTYTGYLRQAVTYDVPGIHGNTDSSAEVKFPAVTGLDSGVQLDAVAAPVMSASSGGMIVNFTLSDPRKLLDNGDKFTLSENNSMFFWDYA